MNASPLTSTARMIQKRDSVTTPLISLDYDLTQHNDMRRELKELHICIYVHVLCVILATCILIIIHQLL